MNRLGRVIVSCALAVLLAGCDKLPDVGQEKLPDVFEDVGNDPHPPSLTLLGIGLQLPTPKPDPDNPDFEPVPPPVAYFPPSTVITVRPYDATANVLSLRVSYADAAGDIDSVTVADLDGPIAGTLTLPDFLGTSRTIEATLEVPTTSAAGLHNLEIWAQDANGSRSPKTSFAVFVQLL